MRAVSAERTGAFRHTTGIADVRWQRVDGSTYRRCQDGGSGRGRQVAGVHALVLGEGAPSSADTTAGSNCVPAHRCAGDPDLLRQCRAARLPSLRIAWNASATAMTRAARRIASPAMPSG